MLPSKNPRRSPVPLDSPDANLTSNRLSIKTSTLRKGATFHAPYSSSYGVSSLRRSQSTIEDTVAWHRSRTASTIKDLELVLAGHALLPSDSSSNHSLPVPRGLLHATLKDAPTTSSVKAHKSRHMPAPHSDHDSGIGSSIVTTDQKPALSTLTIPSSEQSVGLSDKGNTRICERILKPLLARQSFKDFHPIILGITTKIQNKEVVCLRDVEKSLLLSAPDTVKSANLYLEFCLTVAALVHTTADRLSDRDQVRSTDPAYTNGYFIDLCDQLREHARALSAKGTGIISEASNTCSISDEIRMHGGMSVNGRPSELVRITAEGDAYSLADNRKIEDYMEELPDGTPKYRFKRSLSQTAEDEEEIRRSMGRRKKNPTPEELSPKVCNHANCGKQFARPCDLAKHKKTHSRPWKCPVATCKFHKLGWPTEKEMTRHHNDVHSANPQFFHCEDPKCPYKSKRESNLKQHMEKAHQYKYIRTKNNGKKTQVVDNSALPSRLTPIVPNLITPSTSPVANLGAFTNSIDDFNAAMSVFGQADPVLFSTHGNETDLPIVWDPSPINDNTMDFDIPGLSNATTPSPNLPVHAHFRFPLDNLAGDDDIYAAPIQVPTTPQSLLTPDSMTGYKNDAQFPSPLLFPVGHPAMDNFECEDFLNDLSTINLQQQSYVKGLESLDAINPHMSASMTHYDTQPQGYIQHRQCVNAIGPHTLASSAFHNSQAQGPLEDSHSSSTTEDITRLFPGEAPGTDLSFFDPMYFNQSPLSPFTLFPPV